PPPAVAQLCLVRSMKHVARFTVFALSVCTAVAQSKTPAPTTGYKGKALALYAPRPIIPKTLQVAVLPGPASSSWMSTRKPVGLRPREWRRARVANFSTMPRLQHSAAGVFDQALFGKCTLLSPLRIGEIRRA